MNDKIHKTSIEDKSLYQLIIMGIRYSLRRDNGLSSFTIIEIIKDNLPKMEDTFRINTAKQIISELKEALRCPELCGAIKHKAKYYNKNTNAYRILYISDYEYINKKIISNLYNFNELIIDEKISFEDEEDWNKLISFLSNYIS